MPALLSLDDAEAIEPSSVGVKAANLARARQIGLPTLPGFVVTAHAGRPAIKLGASVLSSDGPGRARIAVDRIDLDPALMAALNQCAELGDRLIVRSSSALDADGRFSGTFASLPEIRVPELPTAIRGCWSSVFSVATLARLELSGRAPSDVGLAVLIQPEVLPTVGGWARALDSGVVEIVAVAGSPGPLLAGVALGVRGSVASDGHITGDLADGPVSLGHLLALAQAGRRARDELGLDRMEWGVADGQLLLFQLDREAGSTEATGADVDTGGFTFRGVPASPGRALGLPVFLGLEDLDHPPSFSGAILVLEDPSPVFAPLLWQAAGLVALRGNPAAHLCTVARSLHVPSVVGLDATKADLHGMLGIDGDRGEVRVMPG